MNRYEFDDVGYRHFIVQVCTNMAEEGLLAVDEQGHRSMLLTRADAIKLADMLLLYGQHGAIPAKDCELCGGTGTTLTARPCRCCIPEKVAHHE